MESPISAKFGMTRGRSFGRSLRTFSAIGDPATALSSILGENLALCPVGEAVFVDVQISREKVSASAMNNCGTIK